MNKLCKAVVTLALSLCIPMAAQAAPADWPKELNFGLIPTESSDNITERFDNLTKYLEKQLDMPVKVQVATDYAGVITAMQFKHIDLAYFGPKSYVEAADRANAEALVMEVAEDGSKGYKGVIITKKGSDIKTMEDAKGKTWAFTDPNSTSGTLVPTVYFVKTMKIDPEKYFSKVIYSGSHEASILAIKGGKIDIASTNDLDLARGNGKGWQTDKDFQIVWTSELIPGSPMACRKDLPDTLKTALKEAFLSYTDKEGLKMLKLQGYAAADDATYNPIREQIEVKKQLAAK
ncbi:MAG: phosphonate ABC transporter substrate-binding protein [Desulfobulbaceae bacterium]|nr:MAG: phosphonate ABC transporter substrate-binding protein [Desulfobulbaceae bacterium]